MKTGFSELSGIDFHLRGFEQMWKPSADEPAQRVYGEMYTSDKMKQLEEELRKMPRTEGDFLEWVIGLIMLYSDSAHLANFGTAALWPIYLWFGNLTKYIRCMPTAFAAHHVAYIPSVCQRRHDVPNTN
jgi:hypothetical protein